MNLGYKARFKPLVLNETKIHTFREDPSDRWHAGRTIHHCTGNQTKNYNCFLQNTCTGVQSITILPQGWIVENVTAKIPLVFVDKRKLGDIEVLLLIENDGFESIEDFCDWFQDPFKGKIIHWTDWRY